MATRTAQQRRSPGASHERYIQNVLAYMTCRCASSPSQSTPSSIAHAIRHFLTISEEAQRQDDAYLVSTFHAGRTD